MVLVQPRKQTPSPARTPHRWSAGARRVAGRWPEGSGVLASALSRRFPGSSAVPRSPHLHKSEPANTPDCLQEGKRSTTGLGAGGTPAVMAAASAQSTGHTCQPVRKSLGPAPRSPPGVTAPRFMESHRKQYKTLSNFLPARKGAKPQWTPARSEHGERPGNADKCRQPGPLGSP